MEFEGKGLNVTDTNFEPEVLSSDQVTLVDFWAPWCGPCQMLAPVIEEIAEDYKGRLKVCKVNVDDSPNTAVKYGIMSIPTLGVFKDGEIIDKIVGAVPKNYIEDRIDQHLR